MLRGMDTEELTALLTARPDVTVAPEPRTITELSLRLSNDHSIRAALCQLSVPHLQLAEALQALGDRCARTELERLLGVGEILERAVLDELLADLRRFALAWPDGPVLRIAPGMDRMSMDPLALGQPVAELLAELTVDQLTVIAGNYGIEKLPRKKDWVRALSSVLADAQQLRKALDVAPPGIEKTIDELVWRNPRAYGPIQIALYNYSGYEVNPGLSWLAQYGLLLPSNWDEGQMPREASLALRGSGYHPPLSVERPVPATAVVNPAPTPQVSVVDGVRRLLTLLSTAPAQQLTAGGIGVRELRRIAKELGSTEGQIRLWLELAAALGLLLPDASGDVLPTEAADSWLAESPGRQLAELIEAWQTLGVVPSHRVNSEGKLLPALDPTGSPAIGPPLRADLLGLLARYPEGTAVTSLDSLIDLLAWCHPLRYHDAEVLGPYLVATWTEAQRLGLIADTTMSPLGRAVTAGASAGEIAELARDLLPALVERVRFLPDLTAVVSGPPSAALAELLDAVADLESRDTASTWRFSPSSVRRAMDGGHTAGRLLTQLAEVAEHALPQPVEYLINDVARRHGQLQVRPVACAVCTTDPALTAEIAAHRKLAGLDLTQLSPTVLGSAKPTSETLRLLRAAGYAPVQQSRTGQTVIERPAPRRASDPPPARPGVRSVPVAPDVLARRLAAAGGAVEPPVSTYEQEVKACAIGLDDAQARMLAHAIEHGSAVRIDYVSASGGYTERVIEPIALFFDALQAWCRLRNDERVFRLDRIRAVAPA